MESNAGVVEWGDGSLAWRVLDAQYWGVPQRRKRIFLVADFGGQSAGEILFERESVPRDSATGGETREGTAAGTKGGVNGASGGCLTPWGVQSKRIQSVNGTAAALYGGAGQGAHNGAVFIPAKARSLTARNDGSPCVDRGPDIVATGFKHKASPSAGNIGYKKECAPTLMEGQESAVVVYDMTHADEVMRPVDGGKCQTLNARMGTGGNQVPVVMRMRSGCEGGGKGPLLSVNKSLTLAANGNDQTVFCLAGNTIDREPQNGGNGKGYQEDVSYTLNTMDRHAVAAFAETSFGAFRKDTVAGTQKKSGGGMCGGSETLVCEKSVRRLTPLECERLQGLPENYTLIDDKSCSDSARYKALGNGMAQACADYVIQRIVEVEQ